jgi:hypothetical protein
MKKPPPACLGAVEMLTSYHKEDTASYYSLDGTRAVIIINDPDIADKVVTIMGMLIEAYADNIGDGEGIPVMIPEEPIEA